MSFICYVHHLDAGTPYMEVLGTSELAEAQIRAAELLHEHPGSVAAEIFQDDVSVARITSAAHG